VAAEAAVDLELPEHRREADAAERLRRVLEVEVQTRL
jgi:hypothetical protein